MKIFYKIANVLLVSAFISCFSLTACIHADIKAQGISPPINIQGNFQWKYVDTEFCRLYYYQDNDFVLRKSTEIDSIYKDICDKLKHSAKQDSKENNKVLFFFLDDSTYKKFTGDTSAGAQWRINGAFINLNKKDSSNINGTLRHELIHAVTLYSEDSKVRSCPSWFSEGIAQYYQANIKSGSFQISLIKDAIAKKEIVSWSNLIPPSGKWGNENRPLKYTEAACIYDFLISKYGEEKINSIFYSNGDFNEVIKGITNRSVNELEKDWMEYASRKYNQ